ncbi:hypothetical protein KM043_004840 [Ampulex compressa]|nr:hypothetical protein KM043_004840 [Ampulex compressa]
MKLLGGPRPEHSPCNLLAERSRPGVRIGGCAGTEKDLVRRVGRVEEKRKIARSELRRIRGESAAASAPGQARVGRTRGARSRRRSRAMARSSGTSSPR